MPLLTDLLREVSRSFYLTLRVLPGSIRSQIGLAYLLARATDTIADSGLVPVSKRLDTLKSLRDVILDSDTDGMHGFSLKEMASNQVSMGERVLLERIGEALSLMLKFDNADQCRIRRVLEVITSGQILDLERFGGASATSIVSLRTDAELDDYTYRVAGCVGEFWTQVCMAHALANEQLNENALLADGIRFGKGLQLVNILRDLPRDLQQGRCYIPADLLATVGLAANDLRDPGNEPKFRVVYGPLLERARSHLTRGWAYTCALPWRHARIRLACAWPVLIGLKTLDLLSVNPVLSPELRVKVPRAWVKAMMLSTIFLYPVPVLWQKLAPLPPVDCSPASLKNDS